MTSKAISVHQILDTRTVTKFDVRRHSILLDINKFSSTISLLFPFFPYQLYARWHASCIQRKTKQVTEKKNRADDSIGLVNADEGNEPDDDIVVNVAFHTTNACKKAVVNCSYYQGIVTSREYCRYQNFGVCGNLVRACKNRQK